MTRFLIALLALLGLAAQAPACARVGDPRPAVGVVAAARAGLPAREVLAAGFVQAVPGTAFAPAAPVARPYLAPAPIALSPALPGIDRAHE